MSGAGMNRFDTWEHATLVKFASDCYEKMTEQQKEIEVLREDLRLAINAYRKLVVEHARKTD